MDDSFSTPPQHDGEYWSIEACAWVRTPVPLPQQRTEEPAPERVDA
ncbi:MAG: hypothetical protein LC789_03495 [Actinobacteria bacterium]|nr:hypothetical protein [Actinomycetota bacterium]MCA1721399.1 hypothetical protein [Actinomycetota bacterium]